MKKKLVTIETYNAEIKKIMHKNQSIDETLGDMLDYASRVEIKHIKRRRK